MTVPITHTVVPLYYRGRTHGGPDVTVVKPRILDGYVYVNSDNLLKLQANGLDEQGAIDIWLLDTVEEAETVASILEDGAVCQKLPNGNGVVMRTTPGNFEVNLQDRRRKTRTYGIPGDEVHGSWELDHGQMLTMMNEDEFEIERSTRQWARAVAMMARHMDSSAIQQLQVDLEMIPGAYVSFASRDVGSLAEEEEVEFADMPEAHSILYRRAQKFDAPSIQSEITRDVMGSLFDLIVPDDELDGPAGP
ncbi:hypothetical protein [Roseivivax sp. CAU 1761]